MKKLLSVCLLFILTLSIVGCKIEKFELEISGDNTLEVGCSMKLDTNYEGEEDIIWTSTNNEVATVLNGVVIGISKGEVTITAQVEKYESTFNVAVTNPIVEITIIGVNELTIGDEYLFEYSLSKDVEEEVVWSIDNDEILNISEDGVVTAVGIGKANVIATVYDAISIFEVTVSKVDFNIYITGPNKMNVNEEVQLTVSTVPSDIDEKYQFTSSDDEIATVDENGKVVALSSGLVTITVTCVSDNTIKSSIDIEIIEVIPDGISLVGDTEIQAGEHSFLEVNVTGNVSKEVTWSSSNEQVALCYMGIVLGITPGTVVITATSTVDNNIKATIEINVAKYEAKQASQEDLKRVNDIINNMSLSQKIGQMFVVGFSGTSMPSALSNAINTYNFGNVIYMGYNVTSPKTLTALSNSIQEKMVSSNGVPGFITTDQEGGRVARLVDGGTRFVSQMAMAATNNYNNTYLEGKAVAKELKSYGINMNFAPVLDVNNNPNNPVIGPRSYSDNPVIVSLYGNNLINGFKEENLMGSAKHFPGHGNTSVDSHYGLPIITSSKEELYKTELAPFISSIANDIDSIMTTHIIFSAIDNEYPATLSKKVLTGLLREELGYQGLILTDGMGMDAIKKYFGTPEETAILAVEAGVDVIMYTSIDDPIKCHNALMSAVKNNQITEERINESVRRILLKKLDNGLLDNYITTDSSRAELLADNQILNEQFAKESLTLAKGEFEGLDKTKSTLIVSPTTTQSLGSGLASNSFACYASKYLLQKGFTTCDYKVVGTNMSSSESNDLLNVVNNYEQVVIAMSNVKTSSYTRSAATINSILKEHNNVVIIALDMPYDIMAYQNVETYICVYGYQQVTVDALAKYLNGEFEATGKSPVDEEIYK